MVASQKKQEHQTKSEVSGVESTGFLLGFFFFGFCFSSGACGIEAFILHNGELTRGKRTFIPKG